MALFAVRYIHSKMAADDHLGYTKTNTNSLLMDHQREVWSRPVERGGERERFPGPRDVWGAPPSLKNTENGVPGSFFLT